MKVKKILSSVLAGLMVTGTVITPIAAAAPGTAFTDDEDKWHYEPLEQRVYSDGGYIIDKVSHPTAGPDELDSIMDPQERSQTYSWSMAEGGDYIYIGTGYNSTFYIYHNALKQALLSAGLDDAAADSAAEDLVEVVFGVDTFDETKTMEWDPVIMSINKYTHEVEVIFRESELRKDMEVNPENHSDYIDQFRDMREYGMGYLNVLSGYRMAVEFNGKLYFAGMGNPTATLVEVDPETNTAKIAYAEKITNVAPTDPREKMSNGVHGLVEYDGQLLMCLASSDYDRNGEYSPGGIIVASDDPTQGLANWKIIADQEDFDNLPAVLQTDGLNGGGIWDIIEYNGYLYVTIVTDTTDLDTGIINKQGFAMYRGEKVDGDFEWTQIVGGNEEAEMPFGMGIEYSMSCNLWTYVADDGKEYLYLGTYNDPMLDLNAAFAQSNYELLYNDLDHSIYLYRMNEDEKFEMIGGKDDNPEFPDGPIGNLGAGLGSNSNQYVWRYGEHNGELMVGTYDTSTLTYIFTQIADGQIKTVSFEELEERSDKAVDAILKVLGQAEDSPWNDILDKYLFNNILHGIYTGLCSLLSEMTEGKNPVPAYRESMADWENLKERIYTALGKEASESADEELAELILEQELENAPATYGFWDDLADGYNRWKEQYEAALREEIKEYIDWYKAQILEAITPYIEGVDSVFDILSPVVYYFGVNYYGQQAERGFDLLVSNNGVNFDAITRNGLGSKNNHGLRTIESTDVGAFLGTANPFWGAQLWQMITEDDAVKSYVILDANEGTFAEDELTLTLLGEADTAVEDHDDYADPTREGYEFLGWAETADAEEVLESVVFGEETVTYYAVWQLIEEGGDEVETSEVVLDANGGTFGEEETLTLEGEAGTDVADAKTYAEPTREGYEFLGWAETADAEEALESVVFGEETATYYAVWQLIDDGGDEDDDDGDDDNNDDGYDDTIDNEKKQDFSDIINALTHYRNTRRQNEVTFVADDFGGKVANSSGAEKDKLTYVIMDGARIKYVPSVVVAADYEFEHWYCPETDLTYTSNEIINMVVTDDMTFMAVSLPTNVPPAIPSLDVEETVVSEVNSPELNTEDSYAYLTAKEDGTIVPDEKITRGEVATLLFRLLTEESREAFWCRTNDFSDVPGTHPMNTAISTIANAGIINGYPDGTFRPENTITRAEFASILSKFTEAVGEELLFSDVADHWAAEVIAQIAAAGWINGYEDGTFRPDGLITRAEAVKILNAAAEREFTGTVSEWSDVEEDAWYYNEIQAAAAGELPEWTLLESPWNLFYFAVID